MAEHVPDRSEVFRRLKLHVTKVDAIIVRNDHTFNADREDPSVRNFAIHG